FEHRLKFIEEGERVGGRASEACQRGASGEAANLACAVFHDNVTQRHLPIPRQRHLVATPDREYRRRAHPLVTSIVHGSRHFSISEHDSHLAYHVATWKQKQPAT